MEIIPVLNKALRRQRDVKMEKRFNKSDLTMNSYNNAYKVVDSILDTIPNYRTIRKVFLPLRLYFYTTHPSNHTKKGY